MAQVIRVQGKSRLDSLGNWPRSTRTHLENAFWPNIFVGASFEILNHQQVASGFRPTEILGSDGKSSNA
jgi:hypothetical protein